MTEQERAIAMLTQPGSTGGATSAEELREASRQMAEELRDASRRLQERAKAAASGPETCVFGFSATSALAVAGWLWSVAIDAECEPVTAPRVRELTAALIVARAYLVSAGTAGPAG